MSNSDRLNNDISADFAWAIATGVFANYASFGLTNPVTAGRANGYVTTSATSGVVVRGTSYTPQGANGQRSINSTSANDASAGTGARTVTINYLNASFVLKSETVTLNGVTGVNTVNVDIAFIESIQVTTVGSGGGNAGTIQVWTATGATGSIWGSIATSDNQTFWSHHYVPTGLTCYVLNLTGGATVVAGQTNMNYITNPLAGNTNPQLQIGCTMVHQAAGTWDHDYDVPLAVAGPALVWATERPIAVTASTAVSSFDYIQF